MDKNMYFEYLLLFVICLYSCTFSVEGSWNRRIITNTAHYDQCSNFTLRYPYTDTCFCTGPKSSLCSLTKTEKVGDHLTRLKQLNHNFIEELMFEILVSDKEMDIRGLESFTELQELRITYLLLSTDVNIILNRKTFHSLDKLKILQISVPIKRAVLFSQIISLQGLEILDLTDTANLGRHLIDAVTGVRIYV